MMQRRSPTRACNLRIAYGHRLTGIVAVTIMAAEALPAGGMMRPGSSHLGISGKARIAMWT